MDLTQLLIWLVIGGVCGWLAGLVMRDGGGIIVNIVVGIVGAFLAGLIFHRGTINDNPLDLNSFLVSLVGAIILLAILNLIRRGRVR
ncbi:GlsB/YeaQ/YmgE family stress response membrane protein [Parablastomonas sp. CN1-191]|uniref:GlsB/YeaQ/YmgE family stress response membrane protein n=1 Tax=Parablastomonas sp. CN1-191 TaxID=3400908 RepID=UPI003BF7E453